MYLLTLTEAERDVLAAAIRSRCCPERSLTELADKLDALAASPVEQTVKSVTNCRRCHKPVVIHCLHDGRDVYSCGCGAVVGEPQPFPTISLKAGELAELAGSLPAGAPVAPDWAEEPDPYAPTVLLYGWARSRDSAGNPYLSLKVGLKYLDEEEGTDYGATH
jgi:hypothetical protein